MSSQGAGRMVRSLVRADLSRRLGFRMLAWAATA